MKPLPFLLLLPVLLQPLLAAGYRAGAARLDITPEGPIWLSGYASRNKPSNGVLQRLYAKALAVDDGQGSRVVIVTTDLIGLPRALSDVIAARVQKEHGLERARLLLNSSHTHTGPMIRENLKLMANLSPEDAAAVDRYARKLTDQLVQLTAAALGDMKPVKIEAAEGQADFAINRREKTPEGVKIGLNPGGPGDRSVPVIRVSAADGKTIAVLFGYACHNTTLTGEHYKISGDYAGHAQAELEKRMPGTNAMFLQLCAGDQNPNPRSQEKYVEQHGSALAAEVARVLEGRMKPVQGKVRAAMVWQDLPLQPYTRSDFEKMQNDQNEGRARYARAMLQAMDQQQARRSIPFPVQAIKLAPQLTIVALGGEPVIEYALNIKKANPGRQVIVAGYSNDVMGYLPTAKMLEEGGYEPISSVIGYGLPAPFAPEAEKLVLNAVSTVLKRVN